MYKKKILIAAPIILLLTIIIMVGVGVSGKKKPEVTLPNDYKKMLKQSSAKTEIKEDEIVKYANSILSEYPDFVPSDKEIIENDDVVSITYSVKQNGNEITSNEKAYICIGNSDINVQIDLALPGHKVGETVNLENVTIDESGEPADISVKINNIGGRVVYTMDTVEEEWLKENTEYKTVAELKQFAKKEVQSQYEAINTSNGYISAFASIYSLSSVEPDTSLINDRVKEQMDKIKELSGKQSTGKYIKNNFQTTKKEYKAAIKATISEYVKREMILQEIAKEHNITLTDEALNEYYNANKKTLFKMTTDTYEALRVSYYEEQIYNQLVK